MNRSPLRRRSHPDPVSAELRIAVLERDQGCVGHKLGPPFPVYPWVRQDRPQFLELDHVRASGALGKRSRSTLDNLVTLCSTCHRWKTEHGREARPLLLAYLATAEVARAQEEDDLDAMASSNFM